MQISFIWVMEITLKILHSPRKNSHLTDAHWKIKIIKIPILNLNYAALGKTKTTAIFLMHLQKPLTCNKLRSRVFLALIKVTVHFCVVFKIDFFPSRYCLTDQNRWYSGVESFHEKLYSFTIVVSAVSVVIFPEHL